MRLNVEVAAMQRSQPLEDTCITVPTHASICVFTWNHWPLVESVEIVGTLLIMTQQSTVALVGVTGCEPAQTWPPIGICDLEQNLCEKYNCLNYCSFICF